VILPFTVLRRIDYVLEPTKKQVLEEYEQFKDSPLKDALGDMLRERRAIANWIETYALSSCGESPSV
jgi:type I restriction enzyme M protein